MAMRMDCQLFSIDRLYSVFLLSVHRLTVKWRPLKSLRSERQVSILTENLSLLLHLNFYFEFLSVFETFFEVIVACEVMMCKIF